MSNELVEVLNQETGERGQIRRKLFENPVFNNGILVEVDPSQKPYVPELWKSKVEDEEDHDLEPQDETNTEEDEE